MNSLTFSRLIAGILSAAVFSYDSFRLYLGPLFLYIFISDLLDGALARRLAVSTRAGGIFDYVVDRFNFYLVISILVHKGVSIFLLLPYLLRDLLYVSIQVYITLPAIRGTKAASFGGTVGAYIYVLVLNYRQARIPEIELMVFAALLVSLMNLLLRVFRVKDALWEELKNDLSA